MRVKIYQINSDRDADRQKFMSLNDDQTVSSAIYDEVFNAEIDETDLEAIYARFNTSHHPLFRGHSLSVSDVIVMDGKAHYVQSLGFKEIPFDEGQTQKPDNLMRVVYVEPNKPAYEAEVVGTLEGEQAAVQGYIEAIARIAAVKRPPFLLLENVPGLLSHDGGWTFATILLTLSELGYDVTCQNLRRM